MQDASDNNAVSSGLFCNYCFKYVKEHSRHCQICNKCICKFDHHCSILNNCIGQSNYSNFIRLTIFFQFFALNLSTFSLLAILRLIYIQETSHKFLRIPKKAALALNFFNLFVNFSAFFLATGLILFHIYLKYRDMTTYEYILSKRKPVSESYSPYKDHQQKIGTSREIEITRITPENLN